MSKLLEEILDYFVAQLGYEFRVTSDGWVQIRKGSGYIKPNNPK